MTMAFSSLSWYIDLKLSNRSRTLPILNSDIVRMKYLGYDPVLYNKRL